MSIKVEHRKFNSYINLSDEAQAEEDLVERFKQELAAYPNASGKIYIFTNLSMFGQKRRDIDMLILGFTKDFTLKGKFEAKTSTETNLIINELEVNSFICNVEIKSHSSVTYEETNYYVEYSRTNTIENATVQAFETMNSLRTHLDVHLDLQPFICDLLWFRSISKNDLNELRGNVKDNALHNNVTFKELISALLLRANAKFYRGAYHLNTFDNGESDVNEIINLFGTKREAKGLTKTKFESITRQSLEKNLLDLLKNAGEKLTITTGRAGTGKTIQLLQMAFKLADTENNHRCLILTYNRALVSDIQRLIDFTPIPSKVDGRTVAIKTIDSFFQSLMKECGVIRDTLNPNMRDYTQKYNDALKLLNNYVVNKCDKDDIAVLKDIAEQHIDWDFVFVDEAQDFSDIEKEVLFKVYGSNRIIVADGVDQFMRGNKKQKWEEGLKKDEVLKPAAMKLERRQKTNLVRFVNAFAEKANLDWRVEPDENIPGGKIQIFTQYNTDIHISLTQNCKRNKCENYDILILEPPTMIEHTETGSFFKKAVTYEKCNISLYDGTNTNNRTTYPTKDQCRLYQYHSCRGLEGWCVVCDKFDELIDYQMKNMQFDETSALGLDLMEAKKRNVMLWALMPLTRPVDTLVITLNEATSEVGIMLKELANRFPDFVEWNIK